MIRCVGLGEVLWDELPAGRQLGGAPANFAYHTAALGAAATVVSRVGADAAGLDLLARLRALGLPTDAVEIDPRAPTSSVSVALDAAGHAHYTIHENVAWDFLAGESAGRAAIAAADAVCFGSLAQRTASARDAIHALLQRSRPGALRIFDLNLRQHYYSREVITASLALATMLKLNETELPVLRELFALPPDDRGALAELATRFQLRAAIFTRGADGCLVHAGGEWIDHPGKKVDVADTVGAGDSFTAAFAMGLLRGWSLATVVERAIDISAYVCTQRGATPKLPSEITAPFRGGTR
ncbi:MAG: carbohydrate kinase [Opitutae bacterium]|nr:carbohydrate kinase [Opitutae bacterium]